MKEIKLVRATTIGTFIESAADKSNKRCTRLKKVVMTSCIFCIQSMSSYIYFYLIRA